MRARTTHALAGVVAGLATAIVASPAGAAPLPTLGAADGVTATQAGGTVQLRLTGAAATAAAPYDGKELTLQCDTHPRPGLLFASKGDPGAIGTSATLRREADGALTMTTTVNNDRAWDVCEIARPVIPRRRTDRIGPFAIYANGSRPPLARAALTATGTAWVDELGRAIAIGRAQAAVTNARVGGVLSPQEAAAAGLAVLPDEGASPPAGTVGYWTDGRDRVEIVAVSAAGRRLVQESLGGDMERTNVGNLVNSTSTSLGRTEIETDTAHVDRDAKPTPLAPSPDDVPPVLPATVSGTRLTVRFTGKARATLRRLGGRRVSVACGPATLSSDVSDVRRLLAGFQLVAARVPRRGTVLHVRLRAGRDADQCFLRDDGVPVAAVTPTAAGRAVLQDLGALGELLEASDGLIPRATTYPATASLAAAHRKTLVALPGPTAFPSRRDRVGIWTDGARQAVLSVVSPTGHRFVIADEGDGVVRMNINSLLFASALLY